MTIYHIKEDTIYQSRTNALAIPEVCRRFNIPCHTYHLNEFRSRQIHRDSDPKSLFIIESAFGHNSGWSVKELREYLPNGKIVILGGDSIYYHKNNKVEAFAVEEVDWWYDLMPEIVEHLQNKGIKAGLWKWTVSSCYLNKIEEWNRNNPTTAKTRDLMCLMTVNDEYRKRLDRFLKESGINYELGRGVFSSHEHILFPAYAESWVVLGSTSPAWTTPYRTLKGFRDYIAMFLGTVLIYDNHPDIIKYYGGHEVLPIYNYENFNEILEWIQILKDNPYDYQHWLNKQKQWALDNLLESQFTNIFKEIGII